MAATIRLKPLHQQVIVITGASSGIGLVTARMAAREGAKLVLAARNHEALSQLEREINAAANPGTTQAVHVDADVGSEDDVRKIAEAAHTHFGGFDTWVNNAGASVYGRIEEVSVEDFRRVIDTNFWGVVFGSRAAVEHLKARGGALINVGSTLSDRAIPLQGIYVASKHAVKGFTDSLRMEIEEANYPISVTLIKPAAIDTPYTEHAKNYLPHEPKNPPPVYAPETVAKAILHAAVRPERDIFVGGSGKAFSVMEKLAPRATDRYMEATMFGQQQSDEPADPSRPDGLHAPGRGLAERGGYGRMGHVAESSLYTKASLHPWITGAILGAAGMAGVAVAALIRNAGERESRQRGVRQRVHRGARRLADWRPWND
jgi:NAD(P)-dependent dehydrogenase (short-subunit alcohol dehydrogenase family)